MFINDLDLKNSTLVYEEDTKKSDGPGKLTFNNFKTSNKFLFVIMHALSIYPQGVYVKPKQNHSVERFCFGKLTS